MVQQTISLILVGAVLVAAVLLIRFATSRMATLKARLAGIEADARNAIAALRPEPTAEGEAPAGTGFPPPWQPADPQGPVATAWAAVTRGLITTPAGPALAIDPRELLNGDLLYGPRVDLRRFDATPGLLVALGLGATFALLALSISLAVTTLDFTDPDNLTAGMRDLLSTAAVKFITSIVGIGCSVWFIACKNAAVRDTEDALAGLADELARAAPPLRPEMLLADLAQQATRQTELMAARDTRLAKSIADALRAELSKNLNDALKPVTDEMRRISTQVADVNRQQVELMASNFMSQVAGVVHQLTRELAQQMEQAVARFADVPPAISAASDAFRTANDASTEHLKETAAEAARGYEVIATRLRGLAAELDQSDTRIAERLAAFDDGTRETLAGIRDARDTIASAATDIAPLRAAAPALNDVAAALGEAARALRDAASASDGARGRLSADLGTWHASLEQLDGRVAAVIDRVSPLAHPGPRPAA